MPPATRCCGRWRSVCDRRCAAPTCWRGSAATNLRSSRPACDDQRSGSVDLAARISKLIAAPFLLPGRRVEIGTSIGIAMAPEHGGDKEELLKKADLALYRSKSAGRNCYTVYDEAMSMELEARNTLECDLRDAIARCEFEVHYQPFFDFQTGQRRGRGSAGALAPSDQGLDTAGPVHPACRGDRPDHPARRMGDPARLRRCDVLADGYEGRRQPFAGPVQAGRTVRDRQVRAAEFRPAAAAARDRDHRIRPAGTGAENHAFIATAQGPREFRWRSTISAPAIRRSAA